MVVDLEGPLPRRLRLVHGLIRLVQQVLRRRVLAGRKRDPDAAADADLPFAEPEGPPQLVDDPVGDEGGVLERLDLAQEHHELVAAHASHRVRLPDRVPEALPDPAEELVAHQVAEAVVHRLELIQVHEEDGEDGVLVAPAPGPGLLEPIHEDRAGGQARERVVEHLRRHPSLRRRRLVGRLDAAEEAQERLQRVPPRHGLDGDQDRATVAPAGGGVEALRGPLLPDRHRDPLPVRVPDQELLEVHPDEPVEGTHEEDGGRVVRLHHDAVGVDEADGVPGEVEEGAAPLLELQERGLGQVQLHAGVNLGGRVGQGAVEELRLELTLQQIAVGPGARGFHCQCPLLLTRQDEDGNRGIGRTELGHPFDGRDVGDVQVEDRGLDGLARVQHLPGLGDRRRPRHGRSVPAQGALDLPAAR